jgi:Protein of unknown function (DUF3048) N-terminal domain/Protein of unknown function (DUF3048) C-terminal domain
MALIGKRGYTLAAVIGAALLASVGAVALFAHERGEPTTASSATAGPPPPPSPSAMPRPSPPATPRDFLTGRKRSDHEVIAAKVENIAAARPQVGLRFADIVSVEEVEGGQTRLIAVFHTTFPDRLGPVRSARSTDVELLPMFGRPGLVYSGANSKVQAKIDRASIVPIQRSTRDRRRVAPHNVFVDLARIAAAVKTGAARDIGWTFADSDPGWASAKHVSHPSARVGNDTFTFDYSAGRYLVKWRGRSYADGDSGRTATADNVVVLSVRNHGDGNVDVLGSASVMSDTVGRGRATIYRDGKVRRGTWIRSEVSGPMRFTAADGSDIPLTPGRTWVLLQG